MDGRKHQASIYQTDTLHCCQILTTYRRLIKKKKKHYSSHLIVKHSDCIIHLLVCYKIGLGFFSEKDKEQDDKAELPNHDGNIVTPIPTPQTTA